MRLNMRMIVPFCIGFLLCLFTVCFMHLPSCSDESMAPRTLTRPSCEGAASLPEVGVRGAMISHARPDLSLLAEKGLIPLRVFYIWCHSNDVKRRVFEFQHYLSIISVIKYINPDTVHVYHDTTPKSDLKFYHVWFKELLDYYPFMRNSTIDTAICESTSSKWSFIQDQLRQFGGIFINEHTIFTSFPHEMRRDTHVNVLSADLLGFVMAKPNLTNEEVSLLKTTSNINKYCDTSDTHERIHESICVIQETSIYPSDFWNKNDSFSKHIRLLFYGTYDVYEAQPTTSDPIPNIAHMVWMGRTQMNFTFYLSTLSVLYVLKVDTLYIHISEELYGQYWDEIVKEPNVVLVKLVGDYDHIFQHPMQKLGHTSDALRHKILLKYGGLYTDSDVIFARPIPEFLRQYEFVTSYDWPQYYPTWPDYVNEGVALSKPNAQFPRLCLEAFEDYPYKSHMFGYHGLLAPYKVFERFPHLVHIHDRLQVICWKLRCHPSWVPDFRRADMDHLVGPPLNWTDPVAFHFTDPTPTELESKEALLAGSGIWAELGRNVLRRAGRL